MKKIFSKVEEGLLMHTINRYDEIAEKRTDLSPEEEFLQVSVFRLNEGKTFRAHQHIECNKIERCSNHISRNKSWEKNVGNNEKQPKKEEKR